MTSTQKERPTHTRPAWHSDAKWVVGIVAFFLLAVTTCTWSLVRLTERETALTVMSTVTATMFSPGGLDEPGNIESVKAQLANDPSKTVEPLPGVAVSYRDIEGKSPREIRLFIFRKLSEPIYDYGTLTSPNKATVNEEQALVAPTADQLGLLALLTDESHQLLSTILTWLLVASAISLGLLIYLSTGFGRLASPGWVMLLVSCLPFAILTLVALYIERSAPTSAALWSNVDGEPTIWTTAASAALDVAPTLLTALRSIYTPLFWTGLGLVVATTIGGIAYSNWHQRVIRR